VSERVGDKYAFLQFVRATQLEQPEKARRWGEVLSGILSGDLNVGSRKPVLGMPVWATPEVLRGGFATGAYVAGGELKTHELVLARELGLSSDDIPKTRAALNEWFLTDKGLACLHDWIANSCYEADTPEEIALVSIALLADKFPDEARAILREIAPFFDRLRFYPLPLPIPSPKGLHVNSVYDVRQALQRVGPRKDILLQHATLTIWIPLYDRLIDLLSDHGQPNWSARASIWFHDCNAAENAYMASRWAKAGGPFQRCKHVLQNLVTGEPVSLRDERYVELQIARHNAKYGQGSVRGAYRDRQMCQKVDVWHNVLAEISLARIADFRDQGGITESDPLLEPVQPEEAKMGAPIGAELPQAIKRKITAAKIGTIPELIDGGQITSPEVLASLLPKLTAELYGSSFPDTASGFAFTSLFRAFHRRRSLLLLDLQSQVRLDELPWAKALSALRTASANDGSHELKLLDQLVQFTLIHFPHVQFPNPFIEQMQELGKRANIPTPFVSELAADIFMGDFSKNFHAAAIATVRHFSGTLYARYYDLPQHIELRGFAELCFDRAGSRPGQGWSVAHNGMVIEQAMILTSHNLAAVFENLPLTEVDYSDATIRCFEWICDRLQQQSPTHHAKLISLKQSAYAWRQMMAFLSRLNSAGQLKAWTEIKATFDAQTPGFQKRMSPFIDGLEVAITTNSTGTHIKQFLGWSVTRHPLMQD
jgi:hypothetical protein